MRRRLAGPALCFSALALVALANSAVADAVTTRIETRPYYGAIVTIEQGVRVWRALPPHDRIIIVPEGAGKVNINVDSASRQPAPTFNSNVNINNSGNRVDGGYNAGLPYGLVKPHHGGYRPRHH